MRIVSLVPSATEVVCALGLADALVGRSHECDYPPGLVADVPVVTQSLLAVPQGEDDEPLPAGEIDAQVRAAAQAGESFYHIDADRIRDLRPDLIITQGLCDVCAVTHREVVRAADTWGATIPTLDLQATTLAEVLDTFRQIGAATGRSAEADALVVQTEARWQAVRDRVAALTHRPRTLVLEWPDPVFVAGHWNPEIVALAGGVGGPWERAGEPSRAVAWDEIVRFAPEVIVLAACGLDTYRALDEVWPLTDLPGWYDLPAVREGECYTADGSAYFNRPGPRLAESAEILATILAPETFTEMLPPYAVQRFDPDMLEPPKDENEA